MKSPYCCQHCIAFVLWLGLLLIPFLVSGCLRLNPSQSSDGSPDSAPAVAPPQAQADSKVSSAPSDRAEQSETASSDLAAAPLRLFDGQSLTGWKVTEFGSQAECRVENGSIVLEPGFPLTGLTSTLKDLPNSDYEISCECRKTNGIDFFCGLTFPVGESHCSLIVGGWAGSVVGLSMIDGQDANQNPTRSLKKFEKGRWYQIRLRVTSERITAWIDEEQIVDQKIQGHQFSVRNETLLSRPLGICSFETRAEFRKLELTRLTPTSSPDNRPASSSNGSTDRQPAVQQAVH